MAWGSKQWQWFTFTCDSDVSSFFLISVILVRFSLSRNTAFTLWCSSALFQLFLYHSLFSFFAFYTSYLFRPLDKYYVIAFKFPQLKNMFVLFVEKNRTVYFHGDNTCFLVGTSVSLHHSNADFISLAFFFFLCLPHQKEIKGFFDIFSCTGGAVATMCVVF